MFQVGDKVEVVDTHLEAPESEWTVDHISGRDWHGTPLLEIKATNGDIWGVLENQIKPI